MRLPEVLKELSRYKDYYVRCAVAINKNTPVDVLKDLSLSDRYMVRGYVAQNPNTPQDVLMELASDSEVWVRYAVIMNRSNVSEEIIMRVKASNFIQNKIRV